ncbi:MAG: trehalase family glycosidase [Patescibacteria group bacterium]
MQNKIYHQAKRILQKNEKQGFIMPDRGYYQGVWLWDTGFIALGEAYFNPEKSAKRLLNFILKSQWKNGLIPHILFFNQETKGYFPGPKYWQTQVSKNCPQAQTSGITQPPNLAFCVLMIYEKLKEKSSEKAKEFLAKIYPLLLKYHQYLINERDPQNFGLVSIYHPWESGMDNSPRWQEILSRISIAKEQIEEIKFLRKDIKNLTKQWEIDGTSRSEALNLAVSMRPTNEDYARFYYLVKFLAGQNYNDKKIYFEIPFNVKDILFNSVFYVSNEALILMAKEINEKNSEIENYLKKQKQAIEKLYDNESGLYYDLDFKTNKLIKRKTIASFMPLFAGIPKKDQVKKIAEVAAGPEFKGKNSLFLIPSTSRFDLAYHSKSYWRGPIWMPTSWLILRGFERIGLTLISQEIKKSLIELVAQKGFWEYFDAENLTGLGRQNFSWTAALIIDVLKN